MRTIFSPALVSPIKVLVLLSVAVFSVLPVAASGPDLSKYPLRVQVLAAATHSRMSSDPFAHSGSSPVEGMDMATVSGPQLSDSTPIFYGRGWGDLLTPETPIAVNFSYEYCLNRIGPGMAKEPLAARWKDSGKGRVMEVLVPKEFIPSARHPEQVNVNHYEKCDVSVKLYNYVYLRLKSGSILKVSREGYAAKPALHQFVEGVSPTLKERPAAAVQNK